MKSEIGIGVIGCGGMGRSMVRRVLGQDSRLRVNTVYDPDARSVARACRRTSVRSWRVASFGGLNFFVPENACHSERIGLDENREPAYSTWHRPVNFDPFTADKDIVDNQVAIIEYENGVRTTFYNNCNAGIWERRMYILGSEGAIRSDVRTGTIEVRRIGCEEPFEDFSTEGEGGHGGGDDIMVRELAESMTDETALTVGLKEGLESAVTCFTIDEALDNGEVVNLDFYWAPVDANS